MLLFTIIIVAIALITLSRQIDKNLL